MLQRRDDGVGKGLVCLWSDTTLRCLPSFYHPPNEPIQLDPNGYGSAVSAVMEFRADSVEPQSVLSARCVYIITCVAFARACLQCQMDVCGFVCVSVCVCRVGNILPGVAGGGASLAVVCVVESSECGLTEGGQSVMLLMYAYSACSTSLHTGMVKCIFGKNFPFAFFLFFCVLAFFPSSFFSLFAVRTTTVSFPQQNRPTK